MKEEGQTSVVGRMSVLGEGVVRGITSKLGQLPSAEKVTARERGNCELPISVGWGHQPSKGDPSEAPNESNPHRFECRVHVHKLA